MTCQVVFDNPAHIGGGCIFVDSRLWIDVPELQLPSDGGSRSGPTRQKKGYDRGNIDALEETRRLRILSEDDDVAALIMSMLNNRLM